MNNYLQGLPFNEGQGNSSDCDCEGQAFDPAKFKLYTQADRLPTFVLRLPPQGAFPDITYAGECLRIFTCDLKHMIANLTQEESGYKIFKDANSYYVTYDGSAITGLNMDCAQCYRIKIMGFWSEPFWVTDIPQSKITLEFTNKSQLGDVPYQKPLNFVNRIVIDGELCGMDAELFENKKTDAAGKESITFQMLTERKQLFIYNAPEFIQKLIKSIPLHDKFTLSHKGETITPLFKRSDPSSTKNGCCDYDLTITMPLRDLKNIGGKCDADTEGELTFVDVPDDLPDTCEIDDDYLPTQETLCLEINKVPPPILPPITPVGTPPVGAPCPPKDFLITRSVSTVSCSEAFVSEGVKYRTKVLKKLADGNCGFYEKNEFIDPCDVETVSHTITNVTCESTAPPVGTPPVGSPPVGTPPATGDTLEVSLYYSQGGQELKGGVMGGVAPYAFVFKDGNDATIHTANTSGNEVEIPDSVMSTLGNGRLKAFVTDSSGKSGSLFRGKVERDIMRTPPFGFSVSNGDTVNHIDQLNNGDNLQHNTIGVILGEWNNDAKFLEWESTTYNNSGSSAIPEDNVVTVAKSKTYAKRMRIGLHMSIAANKLRNGQDRTIAYSKNALIMRPDGVTPTTIWDPNTFTEMVPSPSSSEALTFAIRRAKAWTKHMLGPINDGVFAAIGIPIGHNAEAELNVVYRNQFGQDEPNVRATGDYHPEGMARFRSNYPQHASKSNIEIHNNFGSKNALDLDWKEHNATEYANFEKAIFDAMRSVPGFNRDAFEQVDVGSATDEDSIYRHTLNVRKRINKYTMLFKTNDRVELQPGTVQFICNHSSSLSMIHGCHAMIEPSPAGGDFDSPEKRGQSAYMMGVAMDRRVGISFVHQGVNNVSIITQQSGVQINQLPKEKQCFKIVNGNKTRPRLTVNISDIFKEGGYGGWEARHDTFKAQQGLVHVDTVSYDNLALSVISPPVGTPPVGSPPVGTPPVVSPPVGTPPTAIGGNVGAYNTKVNGRYYTFSKAPKFDLAFGNDGITDNTSGLDKSGSVSKQDGQNVFYCADYNHMRNEDGSALKMTNLSLPDGIYTLRKFVMNPTKFPDQASFEANNADSGYDQNGINQNNGYVAEIFMSITSDTKNGVGLAPKGLTVSRMMNTLDFSPNQDWTAYNKWLAITWQNLGATQQQYIDKGIQPNTLLGKGPQPKTGLTFKVEQNRVLSVDECYNIGQVYMDNLLGKNPRSYFCSEFIENEQGRGTDSFNRTANVYRGAFDKIKESYPSINVKNTGLFGEYGAFDFYGFLDRFIPYSDRTKYELYLTDKIYKSSGVNGFSANDHDYFTQGHINYMQMNAKFYMFQRKYHYAYEFATINEKVKLATKTYGGQDRERNIIIYTAAAIENMAIGANGGKIGIEQTRTGEIIPFPNGEILTRMNTQPPMPWGAGFTMGFWGTLLCGGALNWDAPNSILRGNPSKLTWWSDQEIKWRPNGSNQWQPYVSGQNGAPETKNDEGLMHSMYAPVTDAFVAGRDSLWPLRDRIQNLRYVPYTSSRGSFTPTPGQAGYHLNGHGPVNWGQFTARDIYDQKKGFAIRGDGMVAYINEYLPANLYEDNVTIAGINLGRVYGGQTAVGIFAT